MVKFTPEEIEGEYDVDVKAGSTLPMNKTNRIQMMETIMTSLAQGAAQGPLSHFMVALIQELLRDYDVKSLKEAYDLDLKAAAKAKAQEQGQASVQDQKTLAETAKRDAQADQIHAETSVIEQEALAGPIGRAHLERIKKEPINPKVNGTGAWPLPAIVVIPKKTFS